jgi:signal transduction histidine kinase/CheY-like chemotaxis protein
VEEGRTTTLSSQIGQEAAGRAHAGARPQAAESLREALLSGVSRYDLNEVSRARTVIWLNLGCVLAWIVINCGAAWWLHNARAAGVAAAGAAMAVAWAWALRQISSGRMASGVGSYTVSGLLLLLAMGLFVPELSLLFTFATFIFLAFGLSYMSGRASRRVVILTLVVAAILLLSSVAFRWTSGVPDDIYRWVRLTGMLMALSIDATMFIMLRRTLEARAQRLVEAEREAAQMQRRISQQERLESIGKLAGGVAHDFNNLLAVIIGNAAFASEAARDRPELLHDIEEVQAAANRAAALTRRLLIFGRRDITHGEVVDLNQVVRDTEGLLRSTVSEHVELRTRLAEDPLWVRIDVTRLEQVLLNLSVNARDAMPDGGPLLIETSQPRFSDQEADETAPRPGRYACLGVTDTGTGFTEQARQHAFEPFFTTKPAGRGTGLGLATVYGIAKDAGGDVRLYSEPGFGTTVRVYLPLADATEAVASPAHCPAEIDGAGRTVLLVEDEPQLRQVTARILERHNYRVRVAETPHDALAMVRGEEQADLLLTDVVMPEMSGLQLAEQAAAVRPHLRHLFMSGFPRDFWERGQIDRDLPIVEKPFDAGRLLSKVSEALAKEPAAGLPLICKLPTPRDLWVMSKDGRRRASGAH